MIDTHCHLDSSRFDGDRPLVLDRAWAAGVAGMLVPAVSPEGWEALLQLPARDPRVQVALGIHPQLLPGVPDSEDGPGLDRLDALLSRRLAVAVGECGLDGPSVARGASLDRQLRVLERQLELAEKHGLPLVLHCLKAHPALMELLGRLRLPPRGVLLHSYSGSAQQARLYAERGCHFSFAGPITYPGARRPAEAARAVPLERLMAETDAPDQAPHPHRGGRSEPAFLPLVVSALASARGLPSEEMAARTADNARAFFRVRPWGGASLR
ncbi:MAG: TatD family hydrolase [Myxococcales bacterium]|nr:TatD family hydrolase [Myxococcales bacterium]